MNSLEISIRNHGANIGSYIRELDSTMFDFIGGRTADQLRHRFNIRSMIRCIRLAARRIKSELRHEHSIRIVSRNEFRSCFGVIEKEPSVTFLTSDAHRQIEGALLISVGHPNELGFKTVNFRSTIALLNSCDNYRNVDFPIPCNTESKRSVSLISELLFNLPNQPAQINGDKRLLLNLRRSIASNSVTYILEVFPTQNNINETIVCMVRNSSNKLLVQRIINLQGPDKIQEEFVYPIDQFPEVLRFQIFDYPSFEFVREIQCQ